jgi:endo-1,4-beta-mannosidase
MKLVVTLSNFWGDYGGIAQYLQWVGLSNQEDTDTDSFYANTDAQKIYKAYISFVLNYKNPYSNKQFKDETSILAWELMNEPRIYDLSRQYQLVNWADETARYIKSIDPNHIISPGIEGFTENYSDYNHGPSLESIAGLSSIEVMSAHFYIGENRQERDPEPAITQWANESQNTFRKPLIIGEVGFDKRSEKTNGVSREVLLKNFLDLSIKNKVNGILIWNWSLKVDSSFGISPNDSRDEEILRLIREYAHKL